MGEISVNIVQRKILLELKGGVSWRGLVGKPVSFPPDVHDHDGRYYTEDEIDQVVALLEQSVAEHTHDIRYFTKEEVTNYIALGLAGLVDVAPEWLNTLAELASAMNNDPDFYNSIIALLAGKAALEHSHEVADIDDFPQTMPPSAHTQSQTTITADPFQTPVFANPLTLDATSHKDFKPALIIGATTINLENSGNGDSGVIEILMDAIGGYAVALGAMFVNNLGINAINNAAGKKNYVFWFNDGSINYTVVVV